MVVRILSVLTALTVLLSLNSCRKAEGEGGIATIKGRVLVYRYNINTLVVQDTILAHNEDVYLLYGLDHTAYDDDYKSSYDGSYAFRNLRPGDYRLFVYSDDTTGLYNQTMDRLKPKIPVFIDIHVGKHQQEIIVPDLITFNNLF